MELYPPAPFCQETKSLLFSLVAGSGGARLWLAVPFQGDNQSGPQAAPGPTALCLHGTANTLEQPPALQLLNALCMLEHFMVFDIKYSRQTSIKRIISDSIRS